MAPVTWKGFIRVLKPVLAGIALAYVGTGFLDGPPPVNFQTEGRKPAKQTEIVEPQAELVIEKNILKLGSLLSVKAEEAAPGASAAPGGGFGDDMEFFYPLESGDDLPSVKGTVTEPEP